MGYTYVYSATLVDTCGFEETALTVGGGGVIWKERGNLASMRSIAPRCLSKSSREYVRDIYLSWASLRSARTHFFLFSR